jgi:hydroxyacylglutathione hydrolase
MMLLYDAVQVIGDYQVGTIKSGRWQEQCYLIRHLVSDSLLLIDPGGEEKRIISAIEQEGGNLSLILLTHGHYDHVGALKPICVRFGLPFFIHPADYKLLRQAPLYGISIEKRNIAIPRNYRFLENETLEWANDDINIIQTPGHTPGGVCFHWKNIAFTGDTLLYKLVVRIGLPGSNAKVMANSINLILDGLPKDTLMFPGHGKPWLVSDASDWWRKNSELPPIFVEENSSEYCT